MRNDNIYLAHIHDAIKCIEQYLQGTTYDQFASDRMRIDATVRELEIIGEASKNLSRRFRDKHPQMPWRQMMDMRNFLIHEYFGVNTKVVWDTCKNDIPKLKDFLVSIPNENAR